LFLTEGWLRPCGGRARSLKTTLVGVRYPSLVAIALKLVWRASATVHIGFGRVNSSRAFGGRGPLRQRRGRRCAECRSRSRHGYEVNWGRLWRRNWRWRRRTQCSVHRWHCEERQNYRESSSGQSVERELVTEREPRLRRRRRQLRYGRGRFSLASQVEVPRHMVRVEEAWSQSPGWMSL
jgi:hypothetical protein